MNKKVLEFLNKCESWKVEVKELHWASNNLSQHELCDTIASAISDFEDLVSEVEQSISGKIKLNTLSPDETKETNLKAFVEDVISSSQDFLKELDKMGEKYVGIKSECETFIGTMQRNLYLVNFTLKEEFKKRLRSQLSESMPKNPMNVGERGFDKFVGRRPKSIKARINQIYKIVKKYGIDSRRYSDDHWQAIEDYYKAITSLGCDVELKPCGHMSHADSMESDGGYCDYDENDGMPRSKQYAIKIIFDDGMNIDGYIKCMACGTMEDPFSRYDTCMVLWPKSNSILEGLNEYGDSKETREKMGMAARRGVLKGNSDSYQDAMNSLNKRNSSKEELNDFQKGFEMENKKPIQVTEEELKTFVREAAMNVIKEYTQKQANTKGFIKSTHGHRNRFKRESTPEEKAEARRRLGIKDEVEESIDIDPKNKGKFTATQKATGKSTEELTHSKNPLTRKRANFAKMAKRHWKPLKK